MGKRTDIQWADSALNLIVGCDSPCEIAERCYARRLVERFAGQPGWPARFERPKLFPDRLAAALCWPDLTGSDRPEKPWLDGMPRLVFVNDLAETFGPWIAGYLSLLGKLFARMGESPHVWILLTKQPEEMREFAEWWQRQCADSWPRNIWCGVSITSPDTLWRAEVLHAIPSYRRILSVEPLTRRTSLYRALNFEPLSKWVIVGGESGHHAKSCHRGWIREIVNECDECRVPCFVKQLGSHSFGDFDQRRFADPKGGDWDEWPRDLRVRQMPLSAAELEAKTWIGS